MWFLVLCIFTRLFWRAREMLMKHPPELIESNPNILCYLWLWTNRSINHSGFFNNQLQMLYDTLYDDIILYGKDIEHVSTNWQQGKCQLQAVKYYLIISWYLHVRNGVAVAAYSRLASRSQVKFHTMKLSPLVRPCAAAPAQSTTSVYRSLDFRRATSSQWGRREGSWPLLLRSVHEYTS